MTVKRLAPGPAGTLAGLRDGRVVALDPAGRERGAVAPFAAAVSALAQRPDGPAAVVGGADGQLAGLTTDPVAVAWRVPAAHRGAVTGVAAAGGVVASGSLDRTVRLWTPAGRPVLGLRFRAAVKGVALSPDGAVLYVLVGGERAVRRWRLDRLDAGLRGLGL